MKTETEHLILESKMDDNNTSAVQKDELQKVFSFIVGRTSRKVSNHDIDYAFNQALAEWT